MYSVYHNKYLQSRDNHLTLYPELCDAARLREELRAKGWRTEEVRASHTDIGQMILKFHGTFELDRMNDPDAVGVVSDLRVRYPGIVKWELFNHWDRFPYASDE